MYTFIPGFFISLIAATIHRKEKFPSIQKIPSILIKIHKRYLHLHHWIICSFLILLLFVPGFLDSQFLLGILLGLTIDGLFYRDRFKILKKIKKKKK